MRRGLVAAGAVLAALLGSTRARATEDTEEQCREAYVATQRLQRSAQLRAARRAAVACGQDQCSTTVRAHCAEWLASIERALPTLLIDVRDGAGEALSGVRVEANGELLSEGWDGRALELDPGEYTLRFSAGGRVVERPTVVREGEKYHRIEVRFEPVAADAAPRAAAVPPWQGSAAAARRVLLEPRRAVPVTSYVLGGIGLAGLTVFTVLGVSGYASERSLRRSCAGACSPEDVDSVRLRYLVADVGLGVGVAGGLAAAALWLWTPAAAEQRGGLALGPAGVRWQGAF